MKLKPDDHKMILRQGAGEMNFKMISPPEWIGVQNHLRKQIIPRLLF